jgi:hypothetical protein
VEVSWRGPLFENMSARFWWDETDIVMGFPFSTKLTPSVMRGPLDVTVVLPSDITRPKGFSCVQQGVKVSCSRVVSLAERARFKDSAKAGLAVAALPVKETEILTAGGQVALWAVLLYAVALWRIASRRVHGADRWWVLVKTVIGSGVFAMGVMGYAYALQGEASVPPAVVATWGSAVMGGIALVYAHMGKNPERPIRSVLGQLLLLGSFFVAIAMAFLTTEFVGPLVGAGVTAVMGWAMTHGESSG